MLLGRIRQTHELIDAVVYRLYGLTEEEIGIVKRTEIERTAAPGAR